MLELVKRRTVDLLVEQFWKQGYLTVSRKYGTYLPEPSKIGKFDVDIIAKFKKNYALGITLTGEDFNDKEITNKINFLATRQTKFTNKRVLLFIGVSSEYFKEAKGTIDKLLPEVKKNIRLFQIIDRPMVIRKRSREKGKVLFS